MADSPLDIYLNRFAERLKALPAERREEELREVRQHMEALVAGHMNRGGTEAQAVEAAIRQFGNAERVGGDLRKADSKLSPSWQSNKGLLIPLFLSCVALEYGFFTSIMGPGDFARTAGSRLLFAVTLTSLSFSVTALAHRYRLKSRKA